MKPQFRNSTFLLAHTALTWLVLLWIQLHCAGAVCGCRCLSAVPVGPCLLTLAAHQASHQGGPRLTFDQACPHCLRALLSSRISCNDLAGLKDDVLDALAADEASQVRPVAVVVLAGTPAELLRRAHVA